MTIFLVRTRSNIYDEYIAIYISNGKKIEKRKLSEFRLYGDRIYMIDFDEATEKKIIERLRTLKRYFLLLKKAKIDETSTKLLYVVLRRPKTEREYKRLDRIKRKIKTAVKERVLFFETKINSILCIGSPKDIDHVRTYFTDRKITGLEKIDEIDTYIKPLFLDDAFYLYKHGIVESPDDDLDKIAFYNTIIELKKEIH